MTLFGHVKKLSANERANGKLGKRITKKKGVRKKIPTSMGAAVKQKERKDSFKAWDLRERVGNGISSI